MNKVLLSISSMLFLVLTSQTAMASDTAKVSRSDHITVQQGIKVYEINPFTDSKRQMRTDRVSVKKASAKKTETIQIKRTDRVRFYKTI